MISRIHLRNFKCFALQNIDMRALTLLAGVNGMGKSSVLQAILLLRQSYLDGVLPGTGLELNGSLVQMGTAQDVLYEDADADEFEIGLVWSDMPTLNLVLQYQREADVLRIAPGSVNPKVFSNVPFTDAFQYLQAERLGPRTTNSISDYQVREHRQLGSSGQYAQHFLHTYGSETVKGEKLLHPGSKTHDLRSQVQAWLQEISPGAEVHLEMHSEMDLINLRYSFVTGEQRSNKYRATSVGFGITYALPVLVALLSSGPGSIVLLENPEAHLHPQGQARMGELLARAAASGIQVIVETHSDHVLNGIRLAVHASLAQPDSIALHYFSRESAGNASRTRLDSPIMGKDGRLDKWPDGFFDEWDKSLEQLLGPGGGQ